MLNRGSLDARAHLVDALIKTGRYKEAGSFYKSMIALNPTLSTVYGMGASLARQGKLDDEFYVAMLDLIETPEIRSMISTLIKAPAIYHPSKLWLYFLLFNTFQIETGGIANFKRTANHNYFNWTADSDIVQQLAALRTELGWSDSDIDELPTPEVMLSNGKPVNFTNLQWKNYLRFLCMLWEVAIKNDRLKLLECLGEPELGNPLSIEYKSHTITQDICNSVMEVNTMMEAVDFSSSGIFRVAELGAGHGRIGNLLLRIIENIQVVIIDIPPALYISQWYLSNLFPERRVFKFRDFSSYKEIQKEFEESSIAFLTPNQIEHLRENTFDLFINISSLHEMTHEQIENWFSQIERVCKGWFYTKQYVEHFNPFDDIFVTKEDYPVRTHWHKLLDRRCVVQQNMFEAVYQLNK